LSEEKMGSKSTTITEPTTPGSGCETIQSTKGSSVPESLEQDRKAKLLNEPPEYEWEMDYFDRSYEKGE
jgi:hypothetical protein